MMPYLEEMTWVKSRKRWTRMANGKRYWVSCKALGTPDNREDSREAANLWWRKKQAELDGVATVVPGTLAAKKAALANYIPPDTPIDTDPRLVAVLALQNFMQQCEAGVPIPDEIKNLIFTPERLHQIETAAKVLDESPPEPARTIGTNFQTWLATKIAKSKIGDLSQTRVHRIRNNVEKFVSFMGEAADVSEITDQKAEAFYHFLASKVSSGDWAKESVRKIMTDSKTFMRWLSQQRLIEYPRTLEGRQLVFGRDDAEPDTFTVEEVRKLYASATGQTRLHILLGLNCCMLAKDISDLRDSEVDWTEGVIARKRSKRSKVKNSAIIRYKLWPETFKLLQQYRSKNPAHVLMTTTGGTWIVQRGLADDGKARYQDVLKSPLVKVFAKAGIKGSFKMFRATASTVVRNGPYQQYHDHILGHGPQTIADKSYAKFYDDGFFQALDWLRKQFFPD
jgi:integrase